MRASSRIPADDELFSAAEIARAARVSVQRVRGLLRGGHVTSHRDFVARADAVRLVQMLSGIAQLPGAARAPLTLLPDAPRRSGPSLVASGALHVGLLLALILITSLGLLNANETEQLIKEPVPLRLVYFMAPGPGGGGGGGGLKMPDLPARVERKAPPKPIKKISSPVPPVRKPPPPRPVVPDPPKPIDPPKPVELPKIDPPKIDPPKVDPPMPAPPQAVQAPVAPVPADTRNTLGTLEGPSSPVASAGPGTGGGVGTGSGTGMGPGRGSGIGPGSGGGIGGGPFQPGNGIEPPTLLKEVRPLYTDDARKRAIEGNVVLEIVVRRDGSVGNLRVLRSLGGGLDEKAMDAVRQWRFGAARRQGVPVDVIVEVSVGFSLR